MRPDGSSLLAGNYGDTLVVRTFTILRPIRPGARCTRNLRAPSHSNVFFVICWCICGGMAVVPLQATNEKFLGSILTGGVQSFFDESGCLGRPPFPALLPPALARLAFSVPLCPPSPAPAHGSSVRGSPPRSLALAQHRITIGPPLASSGRHVHSGAQQPQSDPPRLDESSCGLEFQVYVEETNSGG